MLAATHKSSPYQRKLHGLAAVHRQRPLRLHGLGLVAPLLPQTPFSRFIGPVLPPNPVQSIAAPSGAVPGGSYQQTCQNMAVVNGQLQAQCKTVAGNYVPATGDMTNCGPNGTFTNVNGVLVCDAAPSATPVGPPIAPPIPVSTAPAGIDPNTGIPYAQEYPYNPYGYGSPYNSTSPYSPYAASPYSPSYSPYAGNPVLTAPYVAAPSSAPVQTSAQSGGKIPTWGYIAMGIGGVALLGMFFKK